MRASSSLPIIATVFALCAGGAAAPPAAYAQEKTEPVRVSVNAKDRPVREVVMDLFQQARIRNYTIANNVTGYITLSLKDKPFEEALTLLARTASPRLTWSKTDGFYEVRVRTTRRAAEAAEPAPAFDETAVEGADGTRVEVIHLMYADARDIVAVFEALRPPTLTGAFAYVPNNDVLTKWDPRAPAGTFTSGVIGGFRSPFATGFGQGPATGAGTAPPSPGGQAGQGNPLLPPGVNPPLGVR